MIIKETLQEQRNLPDDPLAFFKKVTGDVLHFLETDYEFKQVSIEIDDTMEWVPIIECRIIYRNATTEITVRYDWYEDLRGTPELIIARLNQEPEGQAQPVEGYNIDLLISERCPNKIIKKQKYNSEEKIADILQSYADVLKEHGRDVLTGDFRIFPILRTRLEKEIDNNKTVILNAADYNDDVDEAS
jgi:hypothetical protein